MTRSPVRYQRLFRVDEEGASRELGLAEVAAHDAGAGDHQLADAPAGTSRPSSSTTRARSGGQTVPIGKGSVRSSGMAAGMGYAVQTLVSVGP